MTSALMIIEAVLGTLLVASPVLLIAKSRRAAAKKHPDTAPEDTAPEEPFSSSQPDAAVEVVAEEPVSCSQTPIVPHEPEGPFLGPTVSNENQRTYVIKREWINLAVRPELSDFDVPYDHVVAATVALALEDCGYHMTHLTIGGGSDEVSHTGAVAYDGYYDSLQSFIQTAPANYRKAKEDATKEYGSWFSSLNWFFVRSKFVREGSAVKVDVDNICRVTLTWEFDSADGIDEEVETVKAALCADEA